MPLVEDVFYVYAPKHILLLEINSTKVYIWDAYWSRVKMTKITTSADSVVIQFWLHSATSEDAGRYYCYKKNRVDSVRDCSHILYVQGIQDPYIVTSGPIRDKAVVNLTCCSYLRMWLWDTSKRTVMNWMKNGNNLQNDDRHLITDLIRGRDYFWKSTLTTMDFNEDDKIDHFSCNIHLEYGLMSVWSPEVSLSANFSQLLHKHYVVAQEGENASLMLEAPRSDGWFSVKNSKTDQIFFSVDGIKVNVSSSYRSKIKIRGIVTFDGDRVIEFSIMNTTSTDAGFMTCHWKNFNGEQFVSQCGQMLIVLRKPAKPNISVTVSTDKIVFTCETNSSSLPHDHDISMIYTWLRNGQVVENGGRYHFSGHTMAVTDVRQEDLGNYSCQATEEQGLASDWSDTSPEMLPKPEVQELTVNGTAHTTVKDSQVVVFRCTVDGYSSQVVYLIQESSLATVNMSRKQQNVYEHAMVVRTCSQLGVYFCSTTSVAGTVEEKQHAVVLNGMPQQQASNVFVTYGKPPSVTIRLTLCSYPGPSKTKWRFTQSGNLRDITDMTKYHLAAKNKKHNVFDYSLVINSISDVDFGAYIFSVEYNETTFDFFIPASKPLEASLPLVVGCSVGAVIITIVVTAGVILSRLKQFRDYWNLKLRRSHITPMQNMSENIEYRGYAEIDDAGISEHDTDNTMQPVVTIPGDDNIPSASGSRNEREIETIELSSGRVDEDEDGEYEEVRPLQTTSCEAQDEQETSAQVQQHDNIEEVVKSEMIMSVPGSSPHSTSSSDVTDVSADGKASGDMAVGIITVFAETSFITHEANETLNAPVINVGMEQLPATMEMSSDMKMEANTTVADETLIEGREDDADIAPGGLTDNRYDSLMPHPPLDSYTALETVDDIMYD
ncbi:uncharacterized protein LOC124122912 isoform X1 [Haliotis rufescens]|uniref:uncharacterized protein LOC124122912 isoform X1 n=1 Tax=Haliotis rufescens TaxID=6454 RepID=UPI00201EED4B|nr:uncharacterized protein LOC124122912 isoform X1 [Haliotis rufescens]